MHIKIENIAKIKYADVKLNGLTVIAGENGSGKSTVGKMLFSVIQVLKSTWANNDQIQENLLKKHLQTLNTRLNSLRINRPDALSVSLAGRSQLVRQLIDGSLTTKQLKEKVNDALNAAEGVTPRMRALIESDFQKIDLCVSNRNNRAAVQAASIQSIIESEFMNSACSINSSKSSVTFDVDDFGRAGLSFELHENKVSSVSAGGHESLQDATYVESPLYLHMLESLSRSVQYVEVERRSSVFGMIPTHIKDFVEKMVYAQSNVSLFEEYSAVLENIENVINGAFRFDKKSHRLYYESNQNSFSPINTASGTKTFGVMQLLLQSDLIGPDRILIWDEPENHLHPQWQITFADVLVRLTSQGVPIVISTHSPYFIQAIRYSAAKYGIEDSVDYYFAEGLPNGLSELNEVTHDLNRVFAKLSYPLNEVMNVDIVRSHD